MGSINYQEVEALKRRVRRRFFSHGQSAVAIARNNCREDTGAMKDSIRFEPEDAVEVSDTFYLIAGGLSDSRVGEVDYAGIWEMEDGFLRSAIPQLLKFC